MPKKDVKEIVAGSSEWESICKCCGYCCLTKFYDKECNRIFMTRIMCDHFDMETKKCLCYDPDVAKRGDNSTGCAAHNGGALNMQSLKNDYLVPGFCAYVQQLLKPKHKFADAIAAVKKCEQTVGFIHEKDLPKNAKIEDYIIPGTDKLFLYNGVKVLTEIGKKNPGK